MKTSVKVALAGTLGGTLLLGGAGTLAYWNGIGTAQGAPLASGKLALAAPDCDPGQGSGSVWTVNGTAAFEPTTAKLVPGDTLVKVCTFTITATGQNLRADVTTEGGQDSGALGAALATTSEFVVDGQSRTTVTSADDGKVLTATVTAALPYGTAVDNATKALSAVISDYVITLTQATNPAPVAG